MTSQKQIEDADEYLARRCLGLVTWSAAFYTLLVESLATASPLPFRHL